MKGFRFGKGLVAAALLVISQTAIAEPPASAKEKAAADSVARFVEQVRKQKGLSKLRRISDLRLRQDACNRAKKDDRSEGHRDGIIGVAEKVGTISAFWYSTADPNQPPAELPDWVTKPQWSEPHRFAVGVCLLGTAGESGERYWIDVGTYMSAIESLLNVPTWD
jgi:hypothetical protein